MSDKREHGGDAGRPRRDDVPFTDDHQKTHQQAIRARRGEREAA